MCVKNISVTNLEKYLPQLIMLLTLAVYLPALWCGFTDFDDPAMVSSNPYIQNGLTLESIRWAFTTGYMANWIPLSWLSHGIDIELFGLNPMAHHAGNVVLHAANTTLLFLFLRKVTGLPWRSALVALLFALHPMHVESVAWIAERKDVLSGFFWMATLYAYCRYTECPGSARYLAVVALFVLGLLSKPMLVTLPLILLLLDWWPLRRTSANSGVSSATPLRLIAEKTPLLLLSLGSSLITYWVQITDGVMAQGYTVMARAGRACISYLTYLWMTVWPVDLAVIYPFEKYPPTPFKMLASLGILLLLTVIALWLRRRLPWLIVGWGWYVISLLPVIGLIQIGQHSVADRYTYLPHSGIFILVVWGLESLRERWSISRQAATAAMVVLLVTLATLTVIQISYWKSSFTLFSHAIKVTKGNWVAHHNLGRLLLNEGKTDEAIEQFNAAIKAKPSHALAFLGLGVAWHFKKEFALSVQSFKSALMFEPTAREANLGLGLVYNDMGDMENAMEQYRILQETGSPYADELMNVLMVRPGNKDVKQK